MSNKIKVDLGNNSYNVSLIESFKNSVVKFASSTKSQCMLITQQEMIKTNNMRLWWIAGIIISLLVSLVIRSMF